MTNELPHRQSSLDSDSRRLCAALKLNSSDKSEARVETVQDGIDAFLKDAQEAHRAIAHNLNAL